MEFRNITSPINTEIYEVDTTTHSKRERTFEINLRHGYYRTFTARISCSGVLMIRFTPLKVCLSEYCEKMRLYVESNPEYMKTYSGITELIDCDELKDKSTFARVYGYKHYLILTEDEYIEVLAKYDPTVEDFNPE